MSKSAHTMLLGDLPLSSRYWLSPLAGYTNWPFRLAVRELGGLGLATTDLVNARALLRANARTLELIQTCAADRPLAVQIYGSAPQEKGEGGRGGAVAGRLWRQRHRYQHGLSGAQGDARRRGLGAFVQCHQHRPPGSQR